MAPNELFDDRTVRSFSLVRLVKGLMIGMVTETSDRNGNRTS